MESSRVYLKKKYLSLYIFPYSVSGKIRYSCRGSTRMTRASVILSISESILIWISKYFIMWLMHYTPTNITIIPVPIATNSCPRAKSKTRTWQPQKKTQKMYKWKYFKACLYTAQLWTWHEIVYRHADAGQIHYVNFVVRLWRRRRHCEIHGH